LGSARSLELRERAHALIPGGAHTYAKGDDQFPELAPTVIARGKGCRVWDVDGNEFVEYGMGLRAVTLGHAFDPVVEAASRQMELGSNYTRPALVEIECAEALLGLLDAADMVKFCKDGSAATTAAVTLARASTGRDLVAVCADHPFFSYNDWFIGTTPVNAGIPEAVRALTVSFRYNDLASLEALFRAHPGEIACVVLEAERSEEPRDGFLEGLQETCRRNGALLVLDEMITGFRWHLGGAQAYYGLRPDLSTFGKAMANGFSVSALVGRREVMELGGLRHPHERVFLLSTTHGAETHALAAAIETIRIYREEHVVEGLYARGERLRAGIEAAARQAGVEDRFQVAGKAPNLVYVTRDQEGAPSQAFRTLFLQETIERGFILPSLVVSHSHGEDEIDRTVEAAAEALVVYRAALEDGVERHLRGRPVQPVYRRYN
jgi:glutamate-1-semialdehyde 2,1-aminomutase